MHLVVILAVVVCCLPGHVAGKNSKSNSGGLPAVSERVEALENALAELTDLVMKKTIMFRVTEVDGHPQPGDVIKFTNNLINTDGVYDSLTGYFTAPENGTYWFSAQLCTKVGKNLSPSMYINDVLANRIYIESIDTKDCSTINLIADMETGDTVTIKNGDFNTVGNGVIWRKEKFVINTFMGLRIGQ